MKIHKPKITLPLAALFIGLGLITVIVANTLSDTILSLSSSAAPASTFQIGQSCTDLNYPDGFCGVKGFCYGGTFCPQTKKSPISACDNSQALSHCPSDGRHLMCIADGFPTQNGFSCCNGPDPNNPSLCGSSSGNNPAPSQSSPTNQRVSSIAIIGDSLSVKTNYSYGTILNKTYGIPTIDSYAVVGAQTSGMDSQLNNVFSSGINYQYIIVFGGVNDLYIGKSAASIESRLQLLYDKIRGQNKGIKVIAVSILPWKNYKNGNQDQTETKRLNNWIQTSAQNVDISVNAYDQYNNPNDDGALKQEYTSDGLHLNGAGQRKLADIIYSQLPR